MTKERKKWERPETVVYEMTFDDVVSASGGEDYMDDKESWDDDWLLEE